MKASARRNVDVLLAGCGLALALYALGYATPYGQRVLSIAGIYALLVLGYQFIFGYGGALALCQGTFMGVGAYVSGILSARYGIGFEASLPLSIGLPLLLALLVAIPVLRLQTHYFALATLIIGQIVLLVAIQWVSVTGGANGIGGVSGLALFGQPIEPGRPTLVLVWGLVALGGLVSYQFARGALGQAYGLMRGNAGAAASIGIDTGRLRLIAFLISAAYAGLAGALYVHTIGVISPDVLELPIMVTCLTIAVVGGRTRIAGAIAAAILVIELPEWFRFLQAYYLIGYGVILLIVIVAAPDGLVAALERLWARLGRQAPAEVPPPAAIPLERARVIDTSGASLLEVRDVHKRFGGVLALDGVSLRVKSGEILGLIGPNGSGKTTLVNLISGLARADAGRIVFAGRDITNTLAHDIARAGIARTFQTVALVDAMSALDNVAVARTAGNLALGTTFATGCLDRRLAHARAEAMNLLVAVGAGEIATQAAGALASATRRRVEIARALALEPRLLLLDEPAAGLNQGEQADLARRLRGIAETGCTLLAIEHNIPFLAALVDRLVCLDDGKVIAEGAPAEVKRDARVIEAYLGLPVRAPPAGVT